MAGLAAAMAGASTVTLMDREPLALTCSMLSAIASGVPLSLDACRDPAADVTTAARIDREHGSTSAAGSSQLPIGSRAAAWLLDADSAEEVVSSLKAELSSLGIVVRNRPNCGTVAAKLLDWDRPQTFGHTHYDVLLATDVLYEAESVAPIATLAPRLLCPNSGRLLLADPAERTRRNRELFTELVGQGGLRLVEQTEQPVAIGRQLPSGDASVSVTQPVSTSPARASSDMIQVAASTAQQAHKCQQQSDSAGNVCIHLMRFDVGNFTANVAREQEPTAL